MSDEPIPTDDFRNMAVASQLFPRAQLHMAEFHQMLQASAEWCAEEQARRQRQGHHEWDRRFRELLAEFGGNPASCLHVHGEDAFDPVTRLVPVATSYGTAVPAAGSWRFSEIAAESWIRQTNDSPSALWADAFRSWSFSVGHWRVASTRHKIAGAAMRKGRNGIWYTAVVVGD